MSDPARSLVDDILQACVAAAPHAWRPEAEFRAARPETADDFDYCLDALYDAGILNEQLDREGRFEGFILSQYGARLAQNPDAAAAFVSAEALDFRRLNTPQGHAIRRTLRSPRRSGLTRLLIGLNLAVFAAGLYLASREKAAGDFLMPITVRNGRLVGVANPAVLDALHRTGFLTRRDLLEGEWWRLIAGGFVHLGVIHLLLNMSALRVLGYDCDWLWGRKGYLLLYLLALLGGSCAAMTRSEGCAGASGALCGLLGAEAVWIVLNRRYLPRRMVRGQLKRILFNGVLIGIVSTLSVVSASAHIGGAVVGAAAACLLHARRFGRPITTRLAGLALVAIPAGCLIGLREWAERDPQWQHLREQIERERVRELKDELWATQRDGLRFHGSVLRPLIEAEPQTRDAAALSRALDALPEHRNRIRDEITTLEQVRPFRTERYEEFRQAAADYFRLLDVRLARIEACLRDNAEWKDDEKEGDALFAARLRFLRLPN